MEANSMTESHVNVGLFLSKFSIGNPIPGAPHMNLFITVNTPKRIVNGVSIITQAINPPLDLHSEVRGSYSYMTVMPNNSHILVVAEGYEILENNEELSQVPNLYIRMVLNEEWTEGTANVKYYSNGSWHEMENVPVNQIQD